MATVIPNEERLQPVEWQPVVLHLKPAVELENDQFFELCQINRDLRIERNAQGELLIMPPTGGRTSERNAEITMQLRIWAKRDDTGVSFDSSGGFVLPNDAVRSPDAAWIRQSRLESVTTEQRKKFIPLCPDFVLELRLPTDPLGILQSKMQEYLDNGAQLGWLIDPETRRVYVFRPASPVECLDKPDLLTGDPVLAGFVLDLREICNTSEGNTLI